MNADAAAIARGVNSPKTLPEALALAGSFRDCTNDGVYVHPDVEGGPA